MSAVPKHHYRETYSAADLAKLTKDFDIGPDHQDDLARFLEDAAAIYRWHQISPEAAIRPAMVKSSLKKVAKLSAQLTEALNGLPPRAEVTLAIEYAKSEDAALMASMGNQSKPKGAALYVPEPDGSETLVTLEMNEVLDVIGHLGRMAAQAADLPPGRIGTKRNDGLRMWVLNMERFWTKTLGRSFSRDATSAGEPVSAAARFCVAAFKPVSPDTPPSRVLNAMKISIRDSQGKSQEEL